VRVRIAAGFLLLAAIFFALAVRYPLRHFASDDFVLYTSRWYAAIRTEGWNVFGREFSDYTPPYLYGLYAVSKIFPNLSAVVATKAPQSVADFVCATLAALLTRERWPRSSLAPVGAFAAVLLFPTVVVNSALWGQCDSLYTSFLLLFAYFAIRERSAAACIAFGCAFAFKLQSLFLAPLVLVLVLRRVLRPGHLLWIPVPYLLAIVPSWLTGRPLADLLTIYVGQATWDTALSIDAPNLFAWIHPPEGVGVAIGLGLAAAACAAYVVGATRDRSPLTPERLVLLATLALVLFPFVLPRMHERYFYAADVFSVVLAFHVPRLAWLPVAIGGASLLSYTPFLWGTTIVPAAMLALSMGIALAALIVQAFGARSAP
jgi:Gpi18-like mannosyltransferase